MCGPLLLEFPNLCPSYILSDLGLGTNSWKNVHARICPPNGHFFVWGEGIKSRSPYKIYVRVKSHILRGEGLCRRRRGRGGHQRPADVVVDLPAPRPATPSCKPFFASLAPLAPSPPY